MKNQYQKGGGVADYFAVLGIGSNLTLKSTQKKLQQQTQNQFGDDANICNTVDEEEACAMVERFYREIVQITILTLYFDGDNIIGGTLTDYDNEEQDQSMDLDDCHIPSPRTHAQSDVLSTISNETSSTSIKSKRKIPISKRYVPRTKVYIPHHSHSSDSTPIPSSPPRDIAGFTILYETLPAKPPSQNSNIDIKQTFSGISADPSADLSMISNKSNDPDSSYVNNLSSMSMNSLDHQNNMALWKRGQTYDADLHPRLGLRSALLSKLLSHSDSSFIHDDAILNMESYTQPEKQSQSHLTRYSIGDFFTGKRVQVPGISKLREIAPIISNTSAKAVVVDPNTQIITQYDTRDLISFRKKYYLGFRRRGPDENDHPAVADLVVRYCRIHQSTLIPKQTQEVFVTSPKSLKGKVMNAHNNNMEVRDILHPFTTTTSKSTEAGAIRRGFVSGANLAAKVAHSGTNLILGNHQKEKYFDSSKNHELNMDEEYEKIVFENCDVVELKDFLSLPEGYTEWVIPDLYHKLRLPAPPSPQNKNALISPAKSTRNKSFQSPSSSILTPNVTHSSSILDSGEKSAQKRMLKTYLFPHRPSPSSGGERGAGVEAFVDSHTFLKRSPSSISKASKDRRNPWSPVEEPPSSSALDESRDLFSNQEGYEVEINVPDYDSYVPKLVHSDSLPGMYDPMSGGGSVYIYVPVIALRRQRVGDEERYKEDPGIVDIGVTFSDLGGSPVMPNEDDDIDEGDNDDNEDSILGRSHWSVCNLVHSFGDELDQNTHRDAISVYGLPAVVTRRNLPQGFLDISFATSVLDRFPRKNYKGVPLPEEELPMFCYPTGCRLRRDKFIDAPLAECYGFVVKNEQGDSIHVSCVSFMEPLTAAKVEQLDQISERRRKTSLPHKYFCERKEQERLGLSHADSHVDDKSSILQGFEEDVMVDRIDADDSLLSGFHSLQVFENKTICIISRYPFWSAFRRFLSHLHIISGSSSDLPLERYISHLLLSIPLPKPGGQFIIVPLPAIASPMVLGLPASKDLPLLDLSFKRLFSCLDIPTVVTTVLGFLALEQRKVIVISTFPSLVSDVCELLRSLLFPFELCCPYVPRLTSPFMSCLEFPGALFAGIHDDGSPDGLAATVRDNIPEDTAIIDLDTGDIDYNRNYDRYEVLKECWEIIPIEARTMLVAEIETLCRDAGIIPGQEPLGNDIEAALNMSMISSSEVDNFDHFDDRAVRDCFLRFFCSILGGYERFLLVPDIDFLISGNDWFDTDGFLATVSSQSRSTFLSAFVNTQLFQSFIQRRTESSDVRCLLFDECIAEFHSSSDTPYGRLGGSLNMKSSDGRGNIPNYHLLVDQCASNTFEGNDSDEGVSYSETSFLTACSDNGFMVNNSGDLVTAPSRKNLPFGSRYIYCVDSHPCFPQRFDVDMFYPPEAEVLSENHDVIVSPVLTRSDRELDVSKVRWRSTVRVSGVQRQRRCLFQLPKLMASHVFNTWLMCIPSQIAKHHISPEQEAKYLLAALGALRVVRIKKHVVPDECGYRCLIIACGRAGSDRRVEIVKLFGLMRSDGIFPSAVTLGQYTRAIAEGFSKRSSGPTDSVADVSCIEVRTSISYDDGTTAESWETLDPFCPFNFLDGNIAELEEAGRSWRYKKSDKRKKKNEEEKCNGDNHSSKPSAKKSHNQSWMPVMCSSSFSPHWKSSLKLDSLDFIEKFKFTAIWSRTIKCENCSYVLLDEEIQGGWDDGAKDDSDIGNELTIKCPRCSGLLFPLLGYKEFDIHTASKLKHTQSDAPITGDLGSFPPQVTRYILPENVDDEGTVQFIPYLSPSRMRLSLEKLVEESGEEVLERDMLMKLDPVLFYNFWWFCARFSLPLPLSISHLTSDNKQSSNPGSMHYIAFAAWDRSVAERACKSAAKSVISWNASIRQVSRRRAGSSLYHLIQSYDKLSNTGSSNGSPSHAKGLIQSNVNNAFALEYPLLSTFNIQLLTQADWDNADLSQVLISLVEACDRRDFFQVVKSLLLCNKNRRARYGGGSSVELECYHTLLYLSRYQCTSAFHKFFPATCKSCKGYHFWCPNGPITIFDRMFRDAVERLRNQGNTIPIHTISDIALGFRSVFGHII